MSLQYHTRLFSHKSLSVHAIWLFLDVPWPVPSRDEKAGRKRYIQCGCVLIGKKKIYDIFSLYDQVICTTSVSPSWHLWTDSRNSNGFIEKRSQRLLFPVNFELVWCWEFSCDIPKKASGIWYSRVILNELASPCELTFQSWQSVLDRNKLCYWMI